MISNESLKNCWDIVQILQQPVLIVETSIGFQAYLCSNFKPKGRDFFQNEVTGGRDISKVVSSLDMHQALDSKYSIETKIESLPYLDFNFGHDSFTLLKSIR